MDVIDYDDHETEEVDISHSDGRPGATIRVPIEGAATYLVGKTRLCRRPGCGTMEDRDLPRRLLPVR